MSKRSRIALLIIITLMLVAALFSVLPGQSLLKVISILVITIAGTLASLAQFTGTDVFYRIFRRSAPSHAIVGVEEVLRYFSENHLLVRCAAIGRPPVYQLDIDYWTNLMLDFTRFLQEPEVLNKCADCIFTLLALQPKIPALFIEPLDLGETEADIRQVLEEIIKRIPGKFIRAKDIRKFPKAIVFASTFSPQIRRYLLQEAEYIHIAILLIGPDLLYLRKIPVKIVSIISTDTLQTLDIGTRREILYPN